MFWKQKWENKCRYLYLNGLNAFLVEYCSVCSTVFPESRGQVAKAPLNSVQISRSVVSDSVTPWTSARQASLSITNSWSSPKLLSIESVMPSNHLILLSPSPPALNLSQHQGLFTWVSSLHQMAKVLESQLQHQSFQWIFRNEFLYDGLVGSPCSPRDSQQYCPTPQLKSINAFVLSFL